jgi:hypothetical protein
LEATAPILDEVSALTRMAAMGMAVSTAFETMELPALAAVAL